MTPFEALSLEVSRLKTRVRELEDRLCDPLLPAYLSTIALDYRTLTEICQARSISPHLPRHRPLIVAELKKLGWTVPRMSRILCIREQHVRDHLQRAKAKEQAADE